MSKRIYIETMGCQMNVSDTEHTEAQLRADGFALTQDALDADVVIFNSCSVRERAAQRVFNRIGQVRKARRGNEPQFGVMGCVAQLEGDALFSGGSPISLVVGTRATGRVGDLLKRLERGEDRVIDLGERSSGEEWSTAPAERRSPYVAFVPIIEGCNKFCTYCIVPFSRGREKSRSASDILAEITELRNAGYREIHLIGQNVNSYRPTSEAGLEGFKGATPFSRLLRAAAASAVERIKFTTSFPRDFHPDIVAALEESDNLCDWVHLPVQSGSDGVLKAMRRGYNVRSYLERISNIKNARKRLSLTTDIIVGFPGETDQDFKATLSLVQQCQFDSLYAFKYSMRTGTPAASLTDIVPEDLKTERLLELNTVQKSIQGKIQAGYVGKIVKVLVEGTSAKRLSDMTGHSTCNKVVNFPGDPSLLGNVVNIEVTAARENSLYGMVH